MKPKNQEYLKLNKLKSKTLINKCLNFKIYSITLIIYFLFILCFSTQVQAQKGTIKTESVAMENLIPFVIETYANVSGTNHITLLIETTTTSFTDEETFLLKQAVKYLSDKLTDDDAISIAAYNALNGVALEEVPATNFKKIYKGINNLSKHLDFGNDDGITVAYQYVNETIQEDVESTIIMVRNPNGTKSKNTDVLTTNTLQNTSAKKQTGNMVLLTAIAVLPELISIIKD